MIWLPFPQSHSSLNLLSHILLQDQHMAQSSKKPCVSSGGVETCWGWLQLSALVAKASRANAGAPRVIAACLVQVSLDDGSYCLVIFPFCLKTQVSCFFLSSDINVAGCPEKTMHFFSVSLL